MHVIFIPLQVEAGGKMETFDHVVSTVSAKGQYKYYQEHKQPLQMNNRSLSSCVCTAHVQLSLVSSHKRSTLLSLIVSLRYPAYQ